jgi:predicted RNA binding protein YcfA (HicA-like mRNA interferase family)
MKVREVMRMLRDDGWILVRTRGSHRIFKHPTKPNHVTVPGKESKDLAIGTLKSILRQAELERPDG